MSSPGSLQVKDSANRLTVRQGDFLPTTFSTTRVENQNAAILDPGDEPGFYYVRMFFITGVYTYNISEADGSNLPIGPSLIYVTNTPPGARTGSIGDWLSFEVMFDVTPFPNAKRFATKIYTTRKLIITGGVAAFTLFDALEYPIVRTSIRPDTSGLLLIRLGCIRTGMLSEIITNPVAPFTRGGVIIDGRFIAMVTNASNPNANVTVVVNPGAIVDNYALGEINVLQPGQSVTFPAGIYQVTFLYIDRANDTCLSMITTASSPATSIYMPDPLVPSIKETLRLGDLNPIADSLLLEATTVDSRVVWVRRGLPIFV